MTRSPTSSAASPRSTKRPKAKARSRPADKKPTRRHKPAASAELLGCLAFDRAGLIPAIAQQFDTGEVLMVAWMNRAALEETLRTGAVCYWSRSRKTLWRKGETSGQVQRLVELRVDCDQDVLLLQVDQAGVACHTGRRSCFFTALRNGKIETIAPVVTHPEKLYGD